MAAGPVAAKGAFYDPFEWAAHAVANKGVFTRIVHSAKFHDVRSAVTLAPDRTGMARFASLGSKAVKFTLAVGRGALGFIPIPGVASGVSAIEESFEGWLRTHRHQETAGSSLGLEQQVKFELKDLSVQELDRYRWKVTLSLQDANRAMAGWDTDYRKKFDEGRPCDAIADVAYAMAQAERRIAKLRWQCLAIRAVVGHALTWCDDCQNGVRPADRRAIRDVPEEPNVVYGVAAGGLLKAKQNVKNAILDRVAEQKKYFDSLPPEGQQIFIHSFHGKCEKWCMCRGGHADDLGSVKSFFINVAKVLSEPVKVSAFDQPGVYQAAKK